MRAFVLGARVLIVACFSVGRYTSLVSDARVWVLYAKIPGRCASTAAETIGDQKQWPDVKARGNVRSGMNNNMGGPTTKS